MLRHRKAPLFADLCSAAQSPRLRTDPS
jgi:hypothetical protein